MFGAARSTAAVAMAKIIDTGQCTAKSTVSTGLRKAAAVAGHAAPRCVGFYGPVVGYHVVGFRLAKGAGLALPRIVGHISISFASYGLHEMFLS